MVNDNSFPAWMPTASGVLSIVAGALGILISLFYATFIAFVMATPANAGNLGWPASFPLILMAWMFLCSILAIIGGVFALRRKCLGLALAGAICALLSCNLASGILGTIALVFITISGEAFITKVAEPVGT